MTAEPKKQPFKVVYDYGEYCEIKTPEGTMRRYTRDQVEALKALMPEFTFQTVVFKDYSQVRV